MGAGSFSVAMGWGGGKGNFGGMGMMSPMMMMNPMMMKMMKGKGKGKGKEGLNAFKPDVKVWVGNLPESVGWKELQEHFNQAGKTKWVEDSLRLQKKEKALAALHIPVQKMPQKQFRCSMVPFLGVR